MKEAELFHTRPQPIVGKAVPTPVGSMNYNVLRELLDELNIIQLNRGAEIGVFQAKTSEHLLKSFSQLTLFCVDPFLDYSEFEENRTQEQMEESKAIARQRLTPFGDRAQLIVDTSVAAAPLIPDGSLDFVFIDAIHTKEAVSQDLTAWFPKVRTGGLVAGHDFSWGGVREAVEEFIEPLGKGAYYTPGVSDVWFLGK
jgi:hypothetical protein